MSLGPDLAEITARARHDLRLGLPVVMVAEGGLWMVLAAETASPDRLDAMRNLGQGAVVAITARRAQTLKARVYDGDLARLILPGDADCRWVRSVADPADDLNMPFKGPFTSARNGDATPHRAAIRLLKEARLLPAAIVSPVPLGVDLNGLTLLDLTGDMPPGLAMPQPVVHARLPMRLAEAGQLHVYRPADGGEEHYAIEVGTPDRSRPVLSRLHSACFTGDVLGSLKCDCGPQLHAALAQIGNEGEGVLLYLNQEGRGIGLANKMRAYSLQDQGFDTVEANHRLGFEDDERDFRIGAEMLRSLGFSSVRLMTNNPRKVAMMEAQAVSVAERVPLKVGETPQNRAYLATKAAKSGHLL